MTFFIYLSDNLSDEGGGKIHFLETIPSTHHNATLQKQIPEKTKRKERDTQQQKDRKGIVLNEPLLLNVFIPSINRKISLKININIQVYEKFSEYFSS